MRIILRTLVGFVLGLILTDIMSRPAASQLGDDHASDEQTLQDEYMLSVAADYKVSDHFLKKANLSEYQDKANQDDSLAQLIVALNYSKIDPLKINSKSYIDLLESSCAQGLQRACVKLGYHFRIGRGVEKDLFASLRLFQRACNSENAQGCSRLAFLHMRGWGVERDAVESAVFYQKSCDLGLMRACYNLGSMYRSPDTPDTVGLEPDYERGLELYALACNGGEPDGCAVLGRVYSNAQTLPIQLDLANTYYQRACDLGDRGSCEEALQLSKDALSVEENSVKWAEMADGKQIYAKALSNDGRLVAVSSDFGIFRIYDTYSGDLVFAAKDETHGAVLNLVFSPDGRFLVIHREYRPDETSISVWDLENKNSLWAKESIPQPHRSAISFSSTGRFLSFRDTNLITSIVEVESGALFLREDPDDFFGQTGQIKFKKDVFDVRFSADDRYLILVHQEGFVHYDTTEKQVIRKQRVEDLEDVAIADRGKLFATVDTSNFINTGFVRFWSLQSGKPKKEIVTDVQHAPSLGFSADGTSLLVMGTKSSKIYDVKSLKLKAVLEDTTGLNRGKFTLKSNFIVAEYDYRSKMEWLKNKGDGYNDKTHFWDARTGNKILIDDIFQGVLLSKDGTRFVADSDNRRSIILGNPLSEFGLDRTLSNEERRFQEQVAATRRDEAERAFQARRDGFEQWKNDMTRNFDKYEKERSANQPGLLESFAQGASSALNEYNLEERRKRDVALRAQQLNNRTRYGGEPAPPPDTRSTSDGSRHSSIKVIDKDYFEPTLLCWKANYEAGDCTKAEYERQRGSINQSPKVTPE